jgi:uncharacterized protein YndB with AHSA1/START domain
MPTVIEVAPVRKSIRVKATPERAFQAFTADMSRWWIKTHSINKSPIKDIVIEPRPGGRWFERGEDGSECDWGRVLSWEPPGRLLLACQLTPQWTFDPALITELELRFLPDGEGTLIELEHRLDGYGDAAEEMFKILDGPNAWAGLLQAFSRVAA